MKIKETLNAGVDEFGMFRDPDRMPFHNGIVVKTVGPRAKEVVASPHSYIMREDAQGPKVLFLGEERTGTVNIEHAGEIPDMHFGATIVVRKVVLLDNSEQVKQAF